MHNHYGENMKAPGRSERGWGKLGRRGIERERISLLRNCYKKPASSRVALSVLLDISSRTDLSDAVLQDALLPLVAEPSFTMPWSLAYTLGLSPWFCWVTLARAPSADHLIISIIHLTLQCAAAAGAVYRVGWHVNFWGSLLWSITLSVFPYYSMYCILFVRSHVLCLLLIFSL